MYEVAPVEQLSSTLPISDLVTQPWRADCAVGSIDEMVGLGTERV